MGRSRDAVARFRLAPLFALAPLCVLLAVTAIACTDQSPLRGRSPTEGPSPSPQEGPTLLQGARGITAIDKNRRVAVHAKGDRPAWADAVAKLAWRDRRGRLGRGTAVLVAPTLAITAQHCVKDWTGAGGTLLFGFDGLAGKWTERRQAKTIVAKSAAGDWAIVRFAPPITTIRPLKPAPLTAHKYDKKHMLLAGYSCDNGAGKNGALLTYDAKCRLKKVRTATGRLLTNAVCYHGASGGPAFIKAKDGDAFLWIGIVQANLPPRNERSFVTYAVYQNMYVRALKDAITREKARLRAADLAKKAKKKQHAGGD